MLLAGAVFVALGVWFQFDDSAFERVVGVVAIVLFGGGEIYLAFRLARPGPALIVNRMGITDKVSAFSAGFLSWSDIEGFGYYEVGRQPFLIVHLTDPDAVLARMGPVTRAAMRPGMRTAGSPVWIPVRMLPISFDELAQEIAQHCRSDTAQQPPPAGKHRRDA